MENSVVKTQHETNLAARKAEEAALRRYQATEWLDSLVGPLGITKQPSEKEFISCLRTGLVLCNAINKTQPGSVQKVVETQLPSGLPSSDSQPLPAFQYFENVKNFLVAAQELKLTTFEAPILERDNLEAGASTKVVDCILELKALHDWKQMNGGNGFNKPPRTPFTIHSVGKMHSQVSEETSLDRAHRRLEMTASCNIETPAESETHNLEELIVGTLAQCMVDKKENIDANFLTSIRSRNPDTLNSLCKSMSSCLQEQGQKMLPKVKPTLKDLLREEGDSITQLRTKVTESSIVGDKKCRGACSGKGYRNHEKLLKMQENELSKLKSLLSRTKTEFGDLQSQLQTDMKLLESQVQEMSTAALGYYKVVKENKNLHNKVQSFCCDDSTKVEPRKPLHPEGGKIIKCPKINQLIESSESQTASGKATTNGKKSQIQKSLCAIGKLINGRAFSQFVYKYKSLPPVSFHISNTLLFSSQLSILFKLFALRRYNKGTHERWFFLGGHSIHKFSTWREVDPSIITTPVLVGKDLEDFEKLSKVQEPNRILLSMSREKERFLPIADLAGRPRNLRVGDGSASVRAVDVLLISGKCPHPSIPFILWIQYILFNLNRLQHNASGFPQYLETVTIFKLGIRSAPFRDRNNRAKILDNLVSCLDRPVSLGMTDRAEPLLNAEAGQEFFELPPHKLSAIIGYTHHRYAEPHNYLLQEEFLGGLFGDG
ncbi:hypothetical protein DCAR_0519427 [Daucus carota subsp. sativus]|uniref:Calponin-homology (CH) domain-containing protein n=1 Tax=Daucus carota subsp. sativus TaxID=79200 RepID=A0AAF0X1I4_DAUCS|nr:hypothetical protein DCAR_0519427 [Daucus carota subsp. sativus]